MGILKADGIEGRGGQPFVLKGEFAFETENDATAFAALLGGVGGGGGDALLKAQNLLDLIDKAVARRNLGVLPYLPDVHFSQSYAGFTYSGQFPTGHITRQLNTTHRNLIGAVLSGNAFSLPAGEYYIEFEAPAMRVDAHKASLHNMTTSTNVVEGSAEHSNNTTGGNNWSRGAAIVMVTNNSHQFAVKHWCNASSGNSFGQGIQSNSSEAPANKYTDVKIWKVG